MNLVKKRGIIRPSSAVEPRSATLGVKASVQRSVISYNHTTRTSQSSDSRRQCDRWLTKTFYKRRVGQNQATNSKTKLTRTVVRKAYNLTIKLVVQLSLAMIITINFSTSSAVEPRSATLGVKASVQRSVISYNHTSKLLF